MPKILAAFLALAALPAALRADEYWVSPAGSDANPGTAVQPFRQIRRGVQAAGPGDVVRVLDGSYLGFDVVNRHGTAAQPITIRAEGSNAVVTVTTDRPDNRDTIFVSASSHVAIVGLRSFNANRAAMRIDASSRVTARNCVFGNNVTWGIFTDFSDDLLIEGNECYGSQVEHGIYHSNSGDRPVIRGNVVHGNRANGIHMNGDLSSGGDGIISGALVEGNLIYGNGSGGGGGINCDGVTGSVIRNNLLYNNHASGIILYRIDGGSPSHDNVVCNNTIDQAADGRWAVSVHDGSAGTRIFNNVMVTRHASRGSLHFSGPADRVGLVSDHNVFTTNARAVTPDDDASFLTLAQWQALGHDTHSFAAAHDALFENSAGADYHLSAASPALDTGTAALGGAAAPAVDREGDARPAGAAHDIGADEAGGGGGGGGAPADGGGGGGGGCGLTGLEAVALAGALALLGRRRAAPASGL